MIKVVSYDENWPAIFEKEKSKIKNILKDNCIEIHHIGSTSVPGLAAKPKIDIIVIAKNRQDIISKMKTIDYQYKGEWNIPLKFGFAKRGKLDANLHMFFDKNHPEIELNIMFRDYLRTHNDAREAYKNIKYQILNDATSYTKVGKLNVPLYTLRKREFIDNIIKQMGYNRLRVLKCLTDNEWQKAESFCNLKITEEEQMNKNLEHFLLYKGVEIIAYAYIDISSKSFKVFGNIQTNELDYFENIINKWLDIQVPILRLIPE